SAVKDELQRIVQLAHTAHVSAEERKLPREQEAQIKTDVRSRGRAASHNRPARLERLHALLPSRYAHVLDNDVHAFFVGNPADFLRNLLLIVVDAVVRAQSCGFFELLLI